VLRRRDLGQASGSEVVHTVLAGETLTAIVGAYGSTLEAVAERNAFNPLALQVGEQLLIPVNLVTDAEGPAPIASSEGAASLAVTPSTSPQH
jgi:LysM repeat protein